MNDPEKYEPIVRNWDDGYPEDFLDWTDDDGDLDNFPDDGYWTAEPDDDGQPSELEEWFDFDPDC